MCWDPTTEQLATPARHTTHTHTHTDCQGHAWKHHAQHTDTSEGVVVEMTQTWTGRSSRVHPCSSFHTFALWDLRSSSFCPLWFRQRDAALKLLLDNLQIIIHLFNWHHPCWKKFGAVTVTYASAAQSLPAAASSCQQAFGRHRTSHTHGFVYRKKCHYAFCVPAEWSDEEMSKSSLSNVIMSVITLLERDFLFSKSGEDKVMELYVPSQALEYSVLNQTFHSYCIINDTSDHCITCFLLYMLSTLTDTVGERQAWFFKVTFTFCSHIGSKKWLISKM